MKKKKNKKKKKRKKINERKREKGQCYHLFPYLCFKVAPCFSYRESPMLSHFFCWALFGLFFLFFLFPHWDNALIMMIITLLFTYNSKLQINTRTNMTLYECLWRCTRMCNDASVRCMKMMNGG